MHFELLLTGRIPSGKGNTHSDARSRLRQQIHFQMEQLWTCLPLKARRELLEPAKSAGFYTARLEKFGKTFVAPVSEELHTACRLSVVFYEPEGSLEVVSHVSDPDNRLAGLLDMLAVPTNEQAAASSMSTTHCLMADDKLVWSISVERRRLLREIEGERMLTRVGVQVFPTSATMANIALVDIPAH
ncbi:MAG: hypothetical protein JWN11_1945 [Hyphomicrobiales bacterium]|nr:hypothetical protein [Hyphomicrobiales bacterium]